MEVKIAFTTQLKAAIGKNEQWLSLSDDASVRDAIEMVAKLHPVEFAQLVLDNSQELLPSILLCVNDQQVEGGETLSDGDTVTLLSAISGG